MIDNKLESKETYKLWLKMKGTLIKSKCNSLKKKKSKCNGYEIGRWLALWKI